MKKELELNPPSMPNFISYKMPVGKKQDGFKSNAFPISELSESEAIEYGELMKQTFIEHWRTKSINTAPTGDKSDEG